MARILFETNYSNQDMSRSLQAVHQLGEYKMFEGYNEHSHGVREYWLVLTWIHNNSIQIYDVYNVQRQGEGSGQIDLIQ